MTRSENWISIEGYEDLYQISNKGRVRACVLGSHKPMKVAVDRSGYAVVRLTKFGIRKKFAIHKLVFSHFNGDLVPGEIVHHIDEDKLNNCSWNLMKVTHSEHRLMHSRRLKPIYISNLSTI